MLETEFGIDFTHYKPSTVTRRIERRVALARAEDVDQYVGWLKRERPELDALYRDLLIGVTSFFRDRDAFNVLEREVLPELLQRAPRDTPLRVWVAGCATGEEAYSLAILVQDLMADLGERPVKIFATDVHRGSLEEAGRGIYDEAAVANVSPDRLARYIRVRDDGAGIPSEVLDSIFDLFVQSSRTLDRSAGGLGVGLTLVRSLVAMHGGTVTAHSDGVGQGGPGQRVRRPAAAGAASPRSGGAAPATAAGLAGGGDRARRRGQRG